MDPAIFHEPEEPPKPPTDERMALALERIAESTGIIRDWVRFFGIVWIIGALVWGIVLMSAPHPTYYR